MELYGARVGSLAGRRSVLRGLVPFACPLALTLYPAPQNRHCLLDIAPHAIERLHHMHIYPIVIFIHYKSAKHIK
jgi:hypothetical protein